MQQMDMTQRATLARLSVLERLAKVDGAVADRVREEAKVDRLYEEAERTIPRSAAVPLFKMEDGKAYVDRRNGGDRRGS